MQGHHERTVYERIKTAGNLPSPTGVALEILRLASEENTTIENLSAALKADPALASRLLRLANAPANGVSKKVASISRAIAMLGMRAVKSLALTFSILDKYRTGGCRGFPFELFWSESLGRGVAARVISKRLRVVAPDEAFSAGLLSGIGRLALATAFPDDYSRASDLMENDQLLYVARAERSFFEIDHAQLAGEMMADWNLPELFCSAVRAQLAPRESGLKPTSSEYRFAQTLYLANHSAYVLTRSSLYRDSIFDLLMHANAIGISPEAFHQLFDTIRDEWREIGKILSIATRQVPTLAEIYAQAEKLQADSSRLPLTFTCPEINHAVC